MDRMASIVGKHGGIVDDYAGDGIKSNFGVPLPRESEAEIDADAVNAVDCALAIGAEMERLNAEWRARGLPTGRTRMGLYTGPAVVALLGSLDRLKYTSIGDVANSAARLETFQKEEFLEEPAEVCWRILVGEPTWARLGGRFEAEPIGKHVLRGRSEPIAVYRIRGRASAKGAAKEEE
jgi:adenylate cyclase